MLNISDVLSAIVSNVIGGTTEKVQQIVDSIIGTPTGDSFVEQSQYDQSLPDLSQPYADDDHLVEAKENNAQEDASSIVVDNRDNAAGENNEVDSSNALMPRFLRNPQIDPSTGKITDDRTQEIFDSANRLSENNGNDFLSRFLDLKNDRGVAETIASSDRFVPPSFNLDLSDLASKTTKLMNDPETLGMINSSDKMPVQNLDGFVSRTDDLMADPFIANPPSYQDQPYVPQFDINDFLERGAETALSNPQYKEMEPLAINGFQDGFRDFLNRGAETALSDPQYKEMQPLATEDVRNGFRDFLDRGAETALSNPQYKETSPLDIASLRNGFQDFLNRGKETALSSPQYEEIQPLTAEDMRNGFQDFLDRGAETMLSNPQYGEMQPLTAEDVRNGFQDFLDRGTETMLSNPQYDEVDNVIDVADIASRAYDIARDPETHEMINSSDDMPMLDMDELSDFLSRSYDIANSPEMAKMIDADKQIMQDDYNNLSSAFFDDDLKQRYRDFFESKGGLEEGYRTGARDIVDSIGSLLLSNSEYDSRLLPDPNIAALDTLAGGLDKIANENYDDGTMRLDSVKSKYMKGSEYKEYVEAGFGGRPIEKIDDDATYNKLDEMRDYGFQPYIEDMQQLAAWEATQAGDDISKAYSMFGKARELVTDAKINYNGEQISREDLHENVEDYFNMINSLFENDDVEVLQADDPNVDPESDMPATIWWSFPGTDISIPSNQDLNYQWSEDGSKLIVWLPGFEDQAVEYDGLEDYENNLPVWGVYRSNEGDPVHQYFKLPRLEYTQSDGKAVSLSYSDTENIMQSLADGTADMDWGFGNIAKDANDRKGFGQMVMEGDYSDILPNMVDLGLGSMPLFTGPTAWPMAVSNAITATHGLDPRLYDYKTNTRYRLSDDMTGEKYLSNVALSGLVPATERFAGIIGGSGGMIGKPLQDLLRRVGAPAGVRYGLDVAGEGVEENVASAWEDYQTNGLSNWFANPVYETDPETGETIMEYNPVTNELEPKIKYDSTYHEVRDPNTPLSDRVSNWWDQQLDNFLAGTALGGVFGAPRIASEALSGSGYFGESSERKALRNLEKLHNVPKYREAKRGNQTVVIGPDDIGTYGEKRH